MMTSIFPPALNRVSSRHRSHIPGRLFCILGAVVLGFWSVTGGQMTAAPPSYAAENALPVPRYVSLRFSKVNLRTGPGVRYPVEWVFVRKGIPVEIVAEYEHWRKVRDWEGTEGWVHRSQLRRHRTMVVTGELRSLRSDPSLEAKVVAKVEPGVYGRIEQCEKDWCRLNISDSVGWLRRSEFWGVYPKEIVN
jgi:SH3-like domain-containing protein